MPQDRLCDWNLKQRDTVVSTYTSELHSTRWYSCQRNATPDGVTQPPCTSSCQAPEALKASEEAREPLSTKLLPLYSYPAGSCMRILTSMNMQLAYAQLSSARGSRTLRLTHGLCI